MSMCLGIYRDARRLHGRGPYKDHLWFTLRRATVEPVFYFQVIPEGYEYGMGYYCPQALPHGRLPSALPANPERMETLAQKLNEQDLFHLEGEEYKRRSPRCSSPGSTGRTSPSAPHSRQDDAVSLWS